MVNHFCANGIRLFSCQNANQIANVEIWIHYGSEQDSHGKYGIAHLIEHMLCDALAIKDILMSKTIYGYTSKDRIRLQFSLNAMRLEESLGAIIHTILQFSCNSAAFKYQRNKVLNEIIGIRATPAIEYILSREQIVYTNKDYCRPIFGERHDVQELQYHDLILHHHQHVGSGLSIFVSGKIDSEKLIQQVEGVHYAPEKNDSTLPKNKSSGETDILTQKKKTLLVPLQYKGVLIAYTFSKSTVYDLKLTAQLLSYAIRELPVTLDVIINRYERYIVSVRHERELSNYEMS